MLEMSINKCVFGGSRKQSVPDKSGYDILL